MNFKDILKPYEEGGTESNPVKRTMGTITDYLLNKKQYPLDIVGGAIFLVFTWLNAGNLFKGDGSYGSKGSELVTSIRLKCDELLKARLESVTYKTFVEVYSQEVYKVVDQRVNQQYEQQRQQLNEQKQQLDNLINAIVVNVEETQEQIIESMPNHCYINRRWRLFINWWHGRKVYNVTS